MRALRFVGHGDDDNHVIVETDDGAERFALATDGPLRDALQPSAPPTQPHPAEELTAEPLTAESAISPREIQMRVRAGASAQELADQHSMTLERVLRFAGPVIGERIRIADEARRAKARRSTTEGQTVVFGEAVDGRFSAHGIDPSNVTWNAHRREDGQWIVTAGWVGGDADRVAQWVFHLVTRTVTPIDDTAADLLSDRPIRPLSSVEEAVRPNLVAAPPLALGIVAFPPMSDLHGAQQGNVLEGDDVYDQEAPDVPAPAARQVGARRTAGAAPARVPDLPAALLPLRLADSATEESSVDNTPAPADARTARLPRVTNLGVAGRDTETEDERAARARIPSWDDILLGVRRKRD